MKLKSIATLFAKQMFDGAKKNLDSIKKDKYPQTNNSFDKTAITALTRHEEEIVSSWLGTYYVTRNLTRQSRIEAINIVINSLEKLELDQNNIIEENIDNIALSVITLSNRLVKLEEENGKNLNHLYSFTSKLLWLKYPHYIPIYDSFAKNSLNVLINSSDNPPLNNGTGYLKFCREWYTVYKIALPIINSRLANNNDYYKVRIFDKMLWLAGKPRY